MKCSQCGHALGNGVRFCSECGSKQELACLKCLAILKPGAKFCPSCGERVPDGNTPSSAQLEQISLAPLAVDLPKLEVKIQSVEADEQNDDGELAITVKYSVANSSNDEWGYFDVRTQIISASGQIVEEAHDAIEQTLKSGETTELEATLWSIKVDRLGQKLELAQTVVTVIASSMSDADLGVATISAIPFQPVALKPQKIGETLQVLSGSVWKCEPDSDQDCSVEVKLLIQNLTAMHIPEVQIAACALDMHGRELVEVSSCDELRPGNIATISASGYAKEKKVDRAKLHVSVLAYSPAAAGVDQYLGIDTLVPKCDERKGVSTDPSFGEDDDQRDGPVHKFEWQMQRGLIDPDSIEDDDVRDALEQVKYLIRANEHDQALASLPTMEFEFSSGNLDSDPGTYFSENSELHLEVDPSDANFSIEIELTGESLAITATVSFELPVREGIVSAEVTEWLSDNGGYSAGFISGGWGYSGDEGGHMVCLD